MICMRTLRFPCGVVKSLPHRPPLPKTLLLHTKPYLLPTLLNVYFPARIKSAWPTEQGLALPVMQRRGRRSIRPHGYDVTKTARVAERQCSLPAEPIHRREHLRPRIGRQPLNQLIEGAGHLVGHFVANDGVKAGSMRQRHSILLFGGERDHRMTGLVVSRSF